MSAIGPGDWVECMDDRPHERCGQTGLVSGAVYRVERVFSRDQTIGRREACWVAGAPLPVRCSWALTRFRPIYPGGELLRILMEPVPGVRDPVAA